VRRRDFITLLGGAAAWPIPAHAQPTRDVRRIAVLMGTTTNDLGRSYLATFTQRLEQLGWSDGRNARIEIRWWSGTLEQMRPVAAELVALSPDVIMAFSNMSATATLSRPSTGLLMLPSMPTALAARHGAVRRSPTRTSICLVLAFCRAWRERRPKPLAVATCRFPAPEAVVASCVVGLLPTAPIVIYSLTTSTHEKPVISENFVPAGESGREAESSHDRG
jgi:hypothetical protein